jgi:enoyl-CoA hydratase/carnithine racemase
MPSELRTERHDATLLLTISDPPSGNQLSEQVVAAGVEALNVAESDVEIRCVILRGDGSDFCSGHDLQRWIAQALSNPEAVGQTVERFHQLIEALRVFPKPVIACVEGTAAGSGFSLALACDLIVAAEDALFSLPQGRVGLTPDGAAIRHLMQALPRSCVTRAAWLGDPLSAQTLHNHGVVNWLAGSGQALARALAVAGELGQAAALNALPCTKELIDQARGRSLNEHLARERDSLIDDLTRRVDDQTGPAPSHSPAQP